MVGEKCYLCYSKRSECNPYDVQISSSYIHPHQCTQGIYFGENTASGLMRDLVYILQNKISVKYCCFVSELYPQIKHFNNKFNITCSGNLSHAFIIVVWLWIVWKTLLYSLGRLVAAETHEFLVAVMIAYTKIRLLLLYATSVLLVMALCFVGRQKDQTTQINGHVHHMEIKTETTHNSGAYI